MNMDFLLNNPTTWGKFNCLFFVEDVNTSMLKNIHNEIAAEFNPEKIIESSFDLKTKVFSDSINYVDISKHNVINKFIFLKENQEIILESFEQKLVIEYLFSPKHRSLINSLFLFRSPIKIFKKFTMVMGFELSIKINDFEESLNKSLSDRSFHPLLILKNNESGAMSNIYELNHMNAKDPYQREFILDYFNKIKQVIHTSTDAGLPAG